MTTGRNIAKGLAAAAAYTATKRLANDAYAYGKRMLGGSRQYYGGGPARYAYRQTNVGYKLRMEPKLQKFDQLFLVGTTVNALKNLELTQIAQGDAINNRFRQKIYIPSIHFHLYQMTTYVGAPSFVRWAVIQARGHEDPTTLGTDFFRGHISNRSVNFNAVSLALHKRHYPISDRYHVFAEGVRTIGVGTTDTRVDSRATNNYCTIDRNVKINRYVTYDSTSETSCTQPIFLVWWTCAYTVNSGVSVTNKADEVASATTRFIDIV